jgi:hypothetical protein
MKSRSGGGMRGGWKALRLWVLKDRAHGRCECRGECGRAHQPSDRCWYISEPRLRRDAGTGKLSWSSSLECAHVDHDTTHNATWNLRAMCHDCHVGYDRLTRRRRAHAADAPDYSHPITKARLP